MNPYRKQSSARRQSGLSYVEVIVAVLIMSVAVVPASNALRTALRAAETDTDTTVIHFQLIGRLESVLAQPFSTIATQAAGQTVATTYSDSAGSANRRLVFVSFYDGDNADGDNNPFTGTDPDLLWVSVEIENTVLSVAALKADL